MAGCPDDAMLAKLAGADVEDNPATRSLRSHVKTCPNCTSRFSGLLQDQQTLDSDWHDQAPVREAMGNRHFRVEQEFAQGGLGTVYRARDERLGRVVAIKQLRALSPESAMRFRREALITARLQHPAIVPVYEAGTFPGGEPFYAMRLVAGRTLRQLVDEAPTLEQRLSFLPNLITVAEAVAYAHSQGVIHRDLKPANVIVGDFGETVLIDWGLAKQLHDADSPAAMAAGGDAGDSTRVGAVMGTPQYMPPEQARGLPVDTRADVYALGAMLYHLLVGLPPYRGSSDEVLKAVTDAAPPAIEGVQRGAPADLIAIARKAMSRGADDRYRDAAAFAADLRRFVSGQLVRAHSYSRSALVVRWLGRHRLPVALSVVFLVALTGVGVAAITRIVRERDRVTVRSNQLVLASARASLASDPTAALTWLKTYPLDGADWNQARSLALEALGMGVASDIWWPNGGVSYGALSPDGKLVAHPSETMPIEVTNVDTGSLVQRIPVDRYLWALHFSPDGRRIFSEGESEAPKLEAWDLASGHVYPTTVGPALYVKALDDAGTRIAFADSRERAVSVVDFTTGRATNVMTLTEPAVDIAVSRKRQRLVVATESGTLVVHDLPSGMTRRLVADGTINGCALTDDGRWMVSFGDTVQLWDLDSDAMTELRGKGPNVFAAIFTAGDSSVAAGDEKGRVFIYDRHSGRMTQTLEGHTRGINSLAVGDDGKRLATASRDGTVRVWDPTSGDSVVLRGHASQAVAATLTDDGRHLLSVSADASMRLWRVPRDGLDALRVHTGEIGELAVLDDTHVVTSGYEDGLVRLTDFAKRTVTTLAAHVGRATDLSLFRDRSIVASAGSGDVVVWWRKSGAIRRLQLSGDPIGHVMSGCDDDQLVTTTAGGSVHLWSLATGASRRVVDGGAAGAGHAASLSRDCRLLAIQAADKQLRIYDLVAGGAPRIYPNVEWVTRLVFSPDDSRLVAGTIDGRLHIFDLVGGRAVVVQHRGEITDVVQSPDGWRVATGDVKGELRVTDLRDGVSRVLSGHTGSIPTLSFSPDGKRLATGSSDQKLRLWDLASGAQIAAITVGDTIVRVAFFPDGKRVATADNTGMVRLWRVTPTGPATQDPSELRRWMATTTNVVLRRDGVLASP